MSGRRPEAKNWFGVEWEFVPLVLATYGQNLEPKYSQILQNGGSRFIFPDLDSD